MAKSKSTKADSADGATMLRAVLEASKPRPSIADKDVVKTQYAVRFAEHVAVHISDGLKPRFKTVEATTKRNAQSEKQKQQLDINFSTPALGLALGISLKSVHLGDKNNHRFTHNTKRNLEELRIEAFGYHKRQPYSVLIAVLFLPFQSCADGKKNNPSSFGAWVKKLRPYTDRTDNDGDYDVFEKIYIALYEPDGSELGFFDVSEAPPKNSRPMTMLSYAQFLDAAYRAYLKRNHADFKWADAGDSPIDPTEVSEDDEADESTADS